MTRDDAIKKIDSAHKHIITAYRMLVNVEKEFPIKCCYPLKDVIIRIGSVDLVLDIVKDDYAKVVDNEPR